jgi:hypothetical protein
VPFAAGGLSDVPGACWRPRCKGASASPSWSRIAPALRASPARSLFLRAEPDGYTLLVNALADVQNLHYLSVPYDPIKDFALIGMVADGPPVVLIVNANLPYKSVADIVADARANPNKVSFGTSGPATSPAIAVTQLNALAKTSIAQVPYRGSGPAAAAVVTGEVQGAFVFYSNARPLHEGGKVRALAVASPKRLANWSGDTHHGRARLRRFDHRGFVGLAAPAKTSRADPRVPQQAPERGHRFDVVSSAARSARHDGPDPAENTPERIRRIHAPGDRATGRARQALGPRPA